MFKLFINIAHKNKLALNMSSKAGTSEKKRLKFLKWLNIQIPLADFVEKAVLISGRINCNALQAGENCVARRQILLQICQCAALKSNTPLTNT